MLLAAFEPTLQALKQMTSTGNVPFSELLVAWNGESSSSNQVNPPVYSMAPGFAFNLRCLMGNEADFHVRPDQPVDFQALSENSSLDKSQGKALVHCLQRKLALIQGPPGTGKSYTGIALIKVLLANLRHQQASPGPIVCVTFTNHALDQLLEPLVDKKITKNLVRIGSQSKSASLAPFNLSSTAGEARRTKLEKQVTWSAHRDLSRARKNFIPSDSS